MAVMGFTKFERFFREAAQVRVDRDDVKRYLDFVNDVIYDVLLIGQATAKANARDIIEPWDPPVFSEEQAQCDGCPRGVLPMPGRCRRSVGCSLSDTIANANAFEHDRQIDSICRRLVVVTGLDRHLISRSRAVQISGLF
jgi:hypothetical protein